MGSGLTEGPFEVDGLALAATLASRNSRSLINSSGVTAYCVEEGPEILVNGAIVATAGLSVCVDFDCADFGSGGNSSMSNRRGFVCLTLDGSNGARRNALDKSFLGIGAIITWNCVSNGTFTTAQMILKKVPFGSGVR